MLTTQGLLDFWRNIHDNGRVKKSTSRTYGDHAKRFLNLCDITIDNKTHIDIKMAKGLCENINYHTDVLPKHKVNQKAFEAYLRAFWSAVRIYDQYKGDYQKLNSNPIMSQSLDAFVAREDDRLNRNVTYIHQIKNGPMVKLSLPQDLTEKNVDILYHFMMSLVSKKHK